MVYLKMIINKNQKDEGEIKINWVSEIKNKDCVNKIHFYLIFKFLAT